MPCTPLPPTSQARRPLRHRGAALAPGARRTRPSILSGLALVFASLCVGLCPPTAGAQRPADVASAPDSAALPPAPAGYREVVEEHVRWIYPEAAEDEVAELRTALPELREQVGEALGALDTGPLELRVGRGPQDLRALAPRGAPPPAYASGVAYPSRGLILLSLTAPESGTRPAMRPLLVHELTHVALHRRVRGASVPRWFTEGLAVQVAEEQTLDRIEALWRASSGGQLLPMSRLSRSFPEHAFEVNVAYAQSADFVGYLLHRRPGGKRKLAASLDALGAGVPFRDAITDGYGMPLDALEAHWRSDLRERYQSWPLALGGGTVWVLAVLVLLVGYFRKRRRDRAKLAAWEAEERRLDQTIDLVEAQIVALQPPPPRDATVPTVVHDGRRHTLH